MAVTLVAAVPVRAAFDPPPKITVIGAERVVRVSAGTESDFDLDESTNENAGPFVEHLQTTVTGDKGSFGSARSAGETQVSSFSVRGIGAVESRGTLGPGEDATVNARSRSDITVVFTVPINAPFTLSANLKASGEDDVCLSRATVSWAGFDANGLPFNYIHTFDCESPPEDATFFVSDTVMAGTPLGLTVEAEAVVITPDSPGDPAQLGVGKAEFKFNLDFGDRDGDGLLDDWEENGIDFEGPGIEIDLPGWGADPDHKDLFIELDAMAGMFGVTADQAITRVFNAFAEAPNYLVDNPDGMDGINLWVLVDELTLENQTLAGTLPEVYAQLQAIKAEHFGTEADRNHKTEAQQILAAKKEIFRYCLWANELDIIPEPLTGFGETPGNDFLVAGGTTEFFDLQDYPSNLLDEALAGLFMHELGHTLNLRHGGQDEIQFKPHYQSVMNYGYAVPLPSLSIEGTPLESLWHLGYSRSLPEDRIALDEGALDEDRIIRTRWPLIFNSAASNDMPPVRLSVASPGPIDWDGNGVLDQTPVARDITRWFDTLPLFIDGDLRTSNDWVQLWYQLSGAVGFDSRPAAETLTPGIPYSDLEAILSAPVTDQRVWGPVIFTDGFDFGDTEGWSATLP